MYDNTIIDGLRHEVAALRHALNVLIIDANRLCDRNQGGSYEEDCRTSIQAARALLKELDR